MLATKLKFVLLPEIMPLDNVVRIEMREGLPVFRAVPFVQDRIETLLERLQSGQKLTAEEQQELARYEELDDFLSLVNRLVRNASQIGNGGDASQS
ncbi:MAG: hypothetical protein RMK99_15690 [Anaerolineales bacterium]|nr:hypothetical protein [Anaerolineales bacterium]